MKKYIVNSAYFNKNVKTEMTQEEFDKWMRVNAAAHYGFFRIVGEESSGHYYVDFDEMWEVTVIETADGNKQNQFDKAKKIMYNYYIIKIKEGIL